MREIKFRAWNKSRKAFDYFTLDNITQYLQTLQLHLLNGDDFCLTTGLHDKNGKEIYENDIVKQFKGKQWEGLYVIFWLQDEFHSGWYFKNTQQELSINRVKDLNVIGNIYENPDLLKS